MTLAKDLLSQARMLAHREPRRPKQASLRRAASAAYYALFHLFVDAASRQLAFGADSLVLRNRVARIFSHGEMKNLCRSLTKWNAGAPPAPIAELLGGSPSKELVAIAGAFLELQQTRHEADYDLARRFARDGVDALIDLAEEAFEAFRRLDRNGNERRVFLVALAFHSRWKRA